MPEPTQSSPNTPERGETLSPREHAARQRTSLVRLVRFAFLVLFLTVTALTVFDTETSGATATSILGLGLKLGWELTLGVAVALGGLAYSIDWFTPNKKISTLGSVFIGLLAAMLATVAISLIIDLLADLYAIDDPDLIAIVKVLLGICLAYLGIVTVLQTQDDIKLVIPYVEFAKQLRGTRPILIDTSAIIDGRLLGIGRTGVLQSPLVIPRFVIDELQRLGDSSDDLKRSRGRRGLDLIAQLQRETRLDVTIDESPVPAMAVDSQLVELAGTMSAMIATTDAQLARVAGIKGVDVLNLNELAAAMRPEVAPGEALRVHVIREGEQAGQGVGYLPDGTMVVVAQASGLIGQDVGATVTGSLQTSAGRLIFAELDAPAAQENTETPAQTTDPSPPETTLAEPATPGPIPPAASGQPPGPDASDSSDASDASDASKRDRTQAKRRNPRR